MLGTDKGEVAKVQVCLCHALYSLHDLTFASCNSSLSTWALSFCTRSESSARCMSVRSIVATDTVNCREASRTWVKAAG